MILDNFFIDVCDVANILAFQFPELLLPTILPSPNSATRLQGETLELVITNNRKASNNTISNLHLCDHYLLSLAYILSCLSSNSPSPISH